MVNTPIAWDRRDRRELCGTPSVKMDGLMGRQVRSLLMVTQVTGGRMDRDTPVIRYGILTLHQPTGRIARIAVGSEEWFAWLDSAVRFVFDDAGGRFYARKKRRGRGAFWYSPG